MAVNLGQFAQNLTASGLMTAEELKAFRRGLPADQQPKDVQALAKALVQAGKLTKYQAGAIYQGKTKGLVLGEYVVLDRIGAGGMGEVLKARHRRMKREVALKVLPPKSLKSPDAVRRFYREVEAIARLSHPNIVTAHDAGEHQGIHYLVMEYVDGQDLSGLIKQHGPLSIDLALECLVQAARGLEYAHKQGVVHRDVKPSNLLLDRSGVVKVLDMGLALMRAETEHAGEDRLTGSGEVMGTCDYMAPEQAEDMHRTDQRADIYSLGCTLYRLLAGKPPYRGETLMQALLAHREAPIPSLCAARPEAPAVLEPIFRRMLAKRPEDRQSSMSEVIRELESCLRAEQSAGDMPSADSTDMALKNFLQSLPPVGLATQKKATEAALEETAVYQAEEPTSPGAASSVSSAVRKRLSVAMLIAGGAALSVVVLGLLIVLFGGNEATLPPRVAEQESKVPAEAAARESAVSGGHVTFLWPLADRADAKLEIDGQAQDLTALASGAAEEQLRVSLPAGEHRVWIARRGYEPFERRFVLGTGDNFVIEPTWQTAAAVVAAEEPPPESAPPEQPDSQAVSPVAATSSSDDAGSPEKPAAAEAKAAQSRAAFDRVQQQEAKFAEILAPVEEKVAAWDFRGALAALEQVSPEDAELKSRIASRGDEVRRMAALKAKIIAAINAAQPPLKKSDLMIRGINGTVASADDQGITAEITPEKQEKHPWRSMGGKAVERLVQLAAEQQSADDWLAGALLAFAAGDDAVAERFLEEAGRGGVDVRPYLGSVASAALKRTADQIASGEYAKARTALAALEEKYGATPWLATNREAVEAMRVEIDRRMAESRQAEAEKLYSKAATLLAERDLFELKSIVEDLKVQYGDTPVVKDPNRKPSFGELQRAVQSLGKRLTVRLDGKGDFTSIQAAIDAAPPVSLIEIHDNGPYHELVTIPSEKPSITLRGAPECWPIVVGPKEMPEGRETIRSEAFDTHLERLVVLYTSHQTFSVPAISASKKGLRGRSLLVWSTQLTVGGFRAYWEDCVLFGRTNVQGAVFSNCIMAGKELAFPHPNDLRFCTIPGAISVGSSHHSPGESVVIADSLINYVRVETESEYTIQNCAVWAGTLPAGAKDSLRVDPQFRDPANLDFRLKPGSPCIGKASDGGDLGCRYTPEMIELVKVALELRARGVISF